MDRIEKFEDIWAWQAARDLNRDIYAVTRKAPLSTDAGLTRQIQRAAISVMSNIAEGFERGSISEFRHFVSIAKGSCAEVRSLLYAAKDVGYISDSDFDVLMRRAVETGRLVGGLRKSLELKGTSVKEEPAEYRIESQGSAIEHFGVLGFSQTAWLTTIEGVTVNDEP